jgi:hypothetical protein
MSHFPCRGNGEMIEALSITMRQGFLFLDHREWRRMETVMNISERKEAYHENTFNRTSE